MRELAYEVKVGDTVRATGLGGMFVSLVEGAHGFGQVVHVQNEELQIVDARVQEKVDQGKIKPQYLNDGILFFDEGAQEILWLSPNDFAPLQ